MMRDTPFLSCETAVSFLDKANEMLQPANRANSQGVLSKTSQPAHVPHKQRDAKIECHS